MVGKQSGRGERPDPTSGYTVRGRAATATCRLSWYFMEPKSYSHFASLFSVHYPGLETVFEP
ncbi:hypothetical protein CBM2592_A230083 [Cupriavidus taiwanensis]|nr:hypothetical protein CBM2588_A180236 [Cupriavidus taiwanensis]SOY50863.1 hypothetical protein CBM2592_A230083 [Cupriavidus taiwanensis]SOY83741.1 hypothetical protein CBM2591_A270093 [Cupriavidus taiwanensis]SOZ57984.1 hypothetical protein CBM2617_A260088 [Cupriavidus taiwanensis]SOZ79780.1 hypothetical protein CBM2618_A230093 [Cupriavidus taiwanensis]